MFRKVYRSLSPRKLQLLSVAMCRMLPESKMDTLHLEALRASENFADETDVIGEYLKIVEKVQKEYDRLAEIGRLIELAELNQDVELQLDDNAPIADAITLTHAVLLATGTSNFHESIPLLLWYLKRTSHLQIRRRPSVTNRFCDLLREITPFPLNKYKRVAIPARETKRGFSPDISHGLSEQNSATVQVLVQEEVATPSLVPIQEPSR